MAMKLLQNKNTMTVVGIAAAAGHLVPEMLSGFLSYSIFGFVTVQQVVGGLLLAIILVGMKKR